MLSSAEKLLDDLEKKASQLVQAIVNQRKKMGTGSTIEYSLPQDLFKLVVQLQKEVRIC